MTINFEETASKKDLLKALFSLRILNELTHGLTKETKKGFELVAKTFNDVFRGIQALMGLIGLSFFLHLIEIIALIILFIKVF